MAAVKHVVRFGNKWYEGIAGGCVEDPQNAMQWSDKKEAERQACLYLPYDPYVTVETVVPIYEGPDADGKFGFQRCEKALDPIEIHYELR